MSVQAVSLSSLLGFFITVSVLTHPSSSAIDSFVYSGCSQIQYSTGTYQSNVKSVLTSLVNSAASSNFNNLKISLPGSSKNDVVYGLFQCRGDLSNSECRDCVAHSVSQLSILCCDATGGVLQLEGCLVKYDNNSFCGVEDKTVVSKKCGQLIGYNSAALTQRDATLDYLAAAGQYFRTGGSGNVQGTAQCVQDLSLSECQDCLTEAIGRLRSECASAAWGNVFLVKCYALYLVRGDYSNRGGDNPNRDPAYNDYDHGNDDGNDDDGDVERTLVILIVLLAGVALIALFVYYSRQRIGKICISFLKIFMFWTLQIFSKEERKEIVIVHC